VVDGSLIIVAGQGTISLSPSLSFKKVLYVSNLAINFLSIRKIIKDLNCNVTLFLDHCIFQDLSTGRTIGQARVKYGLYVCGIQSSSSNLFSLSFISVNSNKDDIWNLHRYLEHPSFKTLKKMFLSLFKNLNVEQFYCEICELAEHHRMSFPLNDSRSLSSFTIIHYDIWDHIKSLIFQEQNDLWCLLIIAPEWLEFTFLEENLIWVISFQSLQIWQKINLGLALKVLEPIMLGITLIKFYHHTLKKKEIIHQSSCVNTLQQNRLAERKNIHLFKITRILLF